MTEAARRSWHRYPIPVCNVAHFSGNEKEFESLNLFVSRLPRSTVPERADAHHLQSRIGLPVTFVHVHDFAARLLQPNSKGPQSYWRAGSQVSQACSACCVRASRVRVRLEAEKRSRFSKCLDLSRGAPVPAPVPRTLYAGTGTGIYKSRKW